MRLYEPITAITDGIISLMTFAFGFTLSWFAWHAAPQSSIILPGLWAAFFLTTGIASLIATYVHAVQLPPKQDERVSKLMIAISGISLYFFTLAVLMTSGGTALVTRLWMWLLIPVGIYLTFVTLYYHYIVFILYSAAPMLLALACWGKALFRGEPTGLLLTGVLVSLAGCIAQASRKQLPPLNHNDIYHLFMIVALTLLFAGALTSLG